MIAVFLALLAPLLAASDTLSPAQSYREMLSILNQNRMGMAKLFGDSILRTIPPASPYHDSVQAKLGYLEDLLVRRTRPSPPPARKWNMTTGIGVGLESFRWERGRSEWARTAAGSYEVVSGMASQTASASAPIDASSGAVAGLEATGGVAFGIGPFRNRLEASGNLGFSRQDSAWMQGFSQARPRVAAAVGGWEVAAAPLWQWLGGELVSEGGSVSLEWTMRGSDRPWAVSVEGSKMRLPRQEMTYRQIGAGISHRRFVSGWIGQMATEVGWTGRTGVESNPKPVRIASCDGIQDGEPASAANLICYAGPSSDSVVSPHPFKGLSGAPYLAGVDLERNSWSSSWRAGATLVVFREFARRRYSVQAVSALATEQSLEPVRWNNSHFGNALGDSLYVYHDRATGQDFLWERDFRGRFLRVERREEALSLQTLAGLFRVGFRPVTPLEFHTEFAMSRSWSNLPDESGERGYLRWQGKCGVAWEW